MHRFDVGGLENGVVNLVNHLEPQSYRHAVIALTKVTDFKRRIKRSDAQFIALEKPPGHGLKIYPQLYRLFRQMRPAIVHTRNLGALEAVVPAWAAGVPVRVHGEHGRDVGDFDGSSRKYQWIRRLYRPCVTQYVAVSQDLSDYLTKRIGIPARRVAQIYNGVDIQRFSPADTGRRPIAGCPFQDPDCWIVGHVGRMEVVKDQLTLALAFVRALQIQPALSRRLRLVMIGEGRLRQEAQRLLVRAGVAHLAWLPGERDDIPAVLRGFDCFVLPSRGEGISNTILEAMATGLPVIATDVGGNVELVDAGTTGELIGPGDPESLAVKVLEYAANPEKAQISGMAGRERVEKLFSLDVMVRRYADLYDENLRAAMRLPAAKMFVEGNAGKSGLDALTRTRS
jgi:sugar transferase (PEP-CTERM/EpsH1 system associated)